MADHIVMSEMTWTEVDEAMKDRPVGILPVGASIFAIFVVLLVPDRRRLVEPIEFPVATAPEPALREAK